MGLKNKQAALLIMVGIFVALTISEGIRQGGTFVEILFSASAGAIGVYVVAWFILRLAGWWKQ